MGEYANYKGESVKIGTCESMYYLRFDQAAEVTPEAGSVHPIRDASQLLFRFPFPWEDGTEPGAYESAWSTRGRNGFGLEGFLGDPDKFEHGIFQATSKAGYLLNIPCPEGTRLEGITYHRNGGTTTVRLVGQRLWNGLLVAVIECAGCGRVYRLPSIEDAEPLIVAARSYADQSIRRERIYDQDAPVPTDARHWHELADRLTAGYDGAAVLERLDAMRGTVAAR